MRARLEVRAIGPVILHAGSGPVPTRLGASSGPLRDAPAEPSYPFVDGLAVTEMIRDLSACLAEQALPAHALVWCDEWEAACVIESRPHLARLVAALPEDKYAGVKRLGSSGPWAQVRGFEIRRNGASGWPLELHPHDWQLGVPDVVWKLISDESAEVSTILWDWVTAGTPPLDHHSPSARPNAVDGYW